MVRLIKKPTKKIQTLCKKYHIKLTHKKGTKRVYKSKRVLMKQIRRKMRHVVKRKKSMFGKRRSRFGVGCGCNSSLKFGKSNALRRVYRNARKKRNVRKVSSKNIRKLHKICKIYKVKIGKKKPETLRKQCLKKAMSLLKKIKS
jgi:hypothetical protein